MYSPHRCDYLYARHTPGLFPKIRSYHYNESTPSTNTHCVVVGATFYSAVLTSSAWLSSAGENEEHY